MSDLLTGAVVALFFALLSLRRTADVDSRSPSDYRTMARRAGWARCLLGVLQVGIVAALLVLVDVCRIAVHVVTGTGVVLSALATAASTTGRPAIGGAR